MSSATQAEDQDRLEDDAGRLRAHRSRRASISLTPLVDVVFILLIFFMLATSFIEWRYVDLESSSRSSSGGGGDTEVVILDVAPEALSLSGAPVEITALETQISFKISEQPELRIVIRPLGGANMQRLMDILDILSRSGATNVALKAMAEGGDDSARSE